MLLLEYVGFGSYLSRALIYNGLSVGLILTSFDKYGNDIAP